MNDAEQITAPALRRATAEDKPAIAALIERSARGLSRDDYADGQIEAAVARVFGVDSELIEDGTYVVAEAGGRLVGCGGWSRRRTLFGGDQAASREAGLLDPATDAAKIRAFFVDPDWARRGVATAILERCEAEAREAGFRAAELMATLPGVKFYRARGYEGDERISYDAEVTAIEFVPMRKRLA